MTDLIECDMCGKQINRLLLHDYEKLQMTNPRTGTGYTYDLCPQCSKQIRTYIGQTDPLAKT